MNVLVVADTFPMPDRNSADFRFSELLGMMAEEHPTFFLALGAKRQADTLGVARLAGISPEAASAWSRNCRWRDRAGAGVPAIRNGRIRVALPRDAPDRRGPAQTTACPGHRGQCRRRFQPLGGQGPGHKVSRGPGKGDCDQACRTRRLSPVRHRDHGNGRGRRDFAQGGSAHCDIYHPQHPSAAGAGCHSREARQASDLRRQLRAAGRRNQCRCNGLLLRVDSPPHRRCRARRQAADHRQRADHEDCFARLCPRRGAGLMSLRQSPYSRPA